MTTLWDNSHLKRVPLLGGPHVLCGDIVEGRVDAGVVIAELGARLRVVLEEDPGHRGCFFYSTREGLLYDTSICCVLDSQTKLTDLALT